jgi:hypothetical protein
VIAYFYTGHQLKDAYQPDTPFAFRPLHFGFSLPAVYGIWLLVVMLLYPLCKAYDRYKSTHRQWWLSYL